MYRSNQIGFGLGAFCGLFVLANFLPGAIYLHQRRFRLAFQAFILPILFWPMFLISIAIADREAHLGSWFLLVLAATASVVSFISVLLVRALPWPRIPAEDLKASQRAATWLLLFGSLLASGLGLYIIVMGVSIIRWILEPAGSAAILQPLMMAGFGPLPLLGLTFLIAGVGGIAMCVRRLRSHAA